MTKKLPLTLLTTLALLAGPTQADLISHYTFDVDDDGTTPDSVGSAFATLGSRVRINTTVPGLLGIGALEMLGGGIIVGPGDGALTSNSFSWPNQARTVTFWWRAKVPNVDTSDGTYVSFGANTGDGTRFDIKELGASNTTLRVRVGGFGFNTNPPNFDDGNWHFVAVTVPNDSTFRDMSWYAGVRGGTLSGDLNTSTSTLAIATGTGPIAFGSSIITAGSIDRVPNGYLDDFQLYNRVLTQDEIQFLYANPGSVIEAEHMPQITSFTLVGGGVWELTLQGANETAYEFRSSTTLQFDPGDLVENLTQGDPGDPGTIGGPNDSVLTTDANGNGTVRLTLSGEPNDFVRAQTAP